MSKLKQVKERKGVFNPDLLLDETSFVPNPKKEKPSEHCKEEQILILERKIAKLEDEKMRAENAGRSFTAEGFEKEIKRLQKQLKNI